MDKWENIYYSYENGNRNIITNIVIIDCTKYIDDKNINNNDVVTYNIS